MSEQVLSLQGDTVDKVCHRHYGHTSGVVEQVLEANPGLAAYGPVLPVATRIIMPEAPDTTTDTTINLWD
ncbi:MAG: tail protein X [Gammaproteobacteria bacterium]|nr:tail protein X [Gammaproteobacteria bacterium]